MKSVPIRAALSEQHFVDDRYLDTLDDEAFGTATTAKPKFTAHADPASQWTAARKGPAFFAFSDNYLIDTDHGIIMDVDASRSNKTAEVHDVKSKLHFRYTVPEPS